jgi:hypothetical protein
MIDRVDFEERIARALYHVKGRRRGFEPYYSSVESSVEAKQIADRLPGLFRTEEIEIG